MIVLIRQNFDQGPVGIDYWSGTSERARSALVGDAIACESLEAANEHVAQLASLDALCMIVMDDPGVQSSQEIVDRLLSHKALAELSYVKVTFLSVERGKRRKVRRLAVKLSAVTIWARH